MDFQTIAVEMGIEDFSSDPVNVKGFDVEVEIHHVVNKVERYVDLVLDDSAIEVVVEDKLEVGEGEI